MQISRRALLAGGLSSLATRGLANRPTPQVADGIKRLVAAADLSGDIGLVVTDLATGQPLVEVAADLPLPPASVTKLFTALYGVEVLGRNHRFDTRVIATGPIENGVLQGNLILAGGGDPNLVTDHLAALAETVSDSGLRAVSGDFLVWDGALPHLAEIDSGQLDHLGYNPTVTGLNLNFNRVYFEWGQANDVLITTLDARSDRYRPSVTTSRLRVVEREDPVFSYRNRGGVDEWTVAREALGSEGARWLPVRNPALYTGEVFAAFAARNGIRLKPPQHLRRMPQGTTIASYRSQPMTRTMAEMLRFSTNITAEAVGLSATAALTGKTLKLRTSALVMARWAERRIDGISPEFVDHSGLGDLSRLTAHDMVRHLAAFGVQPTLLPILRDLPLHDGDGQTIENDNIRIRAKTGTLNFVVTLAGYLQTVQSHDLAFAIFAADLPARQAGKRQGDEVPPGAREWSRRARNLQQDILQYLVRQTG